MRADPQPARAGDAPGPSLIDAVGQYLDGITPLRAEKTVDEYQRDLLAVCGVIEAEVGRPARDISLQDVTVAHLRAAIGAYASAADARFAKRAHLAPHRRAASSVARRTSVVRSFFLWCQRQGILDANPAALLELPGRTPPVPRAFDEDDALRVLDSVVTESRWPERDLVAVLLALACGLRLGEITNLGLTDLVGSPPNRMVVRGKAGKERPIPIPPAVQQAIAAYLPSRRQRLAELGIEASTLIVSSRLRKVRNPNGTTEWSVDRSRGSIAHCVDKTLRKAGLRRPGVRVHALRHTFATLALRENALNIRQLQAVLGHADLSTTQRYTAVSDAEIAAGMRLHPMAGSEGPLADQDDGVS